MKVDRFQIPGALIIERQRRREGPSPVWVAWKPHTSRLFTDVKQLLRFAAWPKSTPTGERLREWISSFDQTTEPTPSLDMQQIKAEGFGPEAHDDDPTANVKMIT